MLPKLKEAVKETARYLFIALKKLRFWRRDPPVTTCRELVDFVETRSKFIAQITLYGYIKTRAGTRYTSLFENDVFIESINIAKWEIYLSCLCDLAIYAAAMTGRAAANTAEIEALATYIVNTATLGEEIPAQRPQGFGDIRAAFASRARLTQWSEISEGENAFHASPESLVEWAPIADELKTFDVTIVKNSMRYKWKRVRDQLIQLLDADSVLADWRSGESRERAQEKAIQGD